MDSDESKPPLLRSPASTSPSRDGPSGNDDLSGDRARRYSPPRSPSPPTPSPLAKGHPTSPSSTSPPAEVFPKNPTASDTDVPSNGSGTRGAASPRRSPTPSSSADIEKQGHQPQPAPKAEEEAAVDSKSKNHKEEQEKASPGEEKEKAAASAALREKEKAAAAAPAALSEKEKAATAPAALSEEEKAAAAPAALSEKEKAAAAAPAALSEKEKAAAAPAALSEKEKAAAGAAASARKKKTEIAHCFPSPFAGVSIREEGDCSKGRSASNGADREHLVDIDGWRNLAVLIHRAEELSYRLGGHPTLSGPVAQLSEALHRFAAATDATAARLGLQEAAAALDTVSSNPDLDILSASAAKLLALEAAAILTASQREHESGPGVSVSAAPADSQAHGSGTSAELFWVAIAGSLALLPYSPEKIPEASHMVVATVFGVVFGVASVGAVMSVRDLYKELARALGVLCFSAFSVLVLAFVSLALAGGNRYLIWIGAVTVAVLHLIIFLMTWK